MEHEESKIQAEIVQEANKYKDLFLFMIKNDGKKTQQQAMRDTAMGLRKGVSDLGCYHKPSGVTYYLEVKTSTGTQTTHQHTFGTMVGNLYRILRSKDDFIKFAHELADQ